ncbi:MAG: hypothetical protein GY794_19655 [bacterium]|nr:hypothetical protein [bacterium]
MKTSAKSKRFRYIAQAGILVVILCAISVHSEGVEPTTQPSEPAATTTKPYTPDNISEAAIELTHRQKIALSAVVDGPSWNEPPFFIMLARTAELVDPKTAAKEYPSLESPAVGYLTDFPNRYRAQKVRVIMRVYESRELVSGSKLWDPRPDWPKGSKVWYLAGWHISQDSSKGEDLVVYSLVDPTKLLGKPSGTTTTGEQFYGGTGRSLELAGVYYKTFRQEALRSSQFDRQFRDYPLILAYYLKATKNAGNEKSQGSALINVLIIGLIVLAVGLYLARRLAKQARFAPLSAGQAGNVQYTPLRNIEDDNIPLDQQENEPVDPALIDAVKAFESKRNTNDATDDKS